jgi:putative holliday junction resolvase
MNGLIISPYFCFMPRILAIDFGLKRTGLAVTDRLQLIATPLDAVESKHLLSFLKAYFLKEEVACVVIGKPTNLQNHDSPIETNIQAFMVDLKKNFPDIIVERFDERFTSKMAQQTILDAGIKKMERRNKFLVDKVSAVILLQSYLEQIQ